MRDRLLIGALIAVTLLMVAAPLYAFDDERRGFVIGFGLGSGMLNQTTDVTGTIPPVSSSVFTPDKTQVTITTSFKVGYAPSNRLAIYYLQNVAWDRTTDNNEVTWGMNGLGGIGASFYFGPQARSFYVLGAYGFSTWTAPFEEQNEHTKTWFGNGTAFGGGWEFADHLSLEVTGMWGNPTKSGTGWDGSIDSFSVLVLFQTLAY